MKNTEVSRRHLLQLAAAGSTTALLGIPSLACAAGKSAGRKAKNIIFLVADGMPLSVPTMADHYLQMTTGKGSYWMWLMDQPWVRNGLQDTRSLNSLVTDSSSAASTWGSGRWIWNGQINCFPDGTKLRTLYSLLQEQGMRTGLVTTTTMTHATPSGFAIVHESRDAEPEIARQHLDAGVDVLMGGGNRNFGGDARSDKRDLYALFAVKRYEIARNTASMNNAGTTGKLLGIFSNSHLPYTVDRVNNPKLKDEVPTLAQMTKKAINMLKGSKEGFILQVEGGRVDHGNHANDLPAAVFDQIEFEEAMKVAIDFARIDGDTLVIITSDHACGGTALNGAGDEYFDSTAGLRTLENMKCSYTNMLAELRLDPKPDTIVGKVKDKLGIELKKPEAEAVSASLGANSPFKVLDFLGNPSSTFGAIMGNHTKVTFTSGNHTNDHVLLTAMGPGSDKIAGLVQNTSLFDIMLAARGLSYSNPRMDFETARVHYAKRQATAKVDRIGEPDHDDHGLMASHSALARIGMV